eukprot:TRINITY_DN1125_c0_g1_i1.p2 TRINITY_DN1125_c0_g1~~TRINITY_DN1125_c0_g1_i1.p2  ORF type:complete len:117 (-),score=12.70 TRINITY_DN1125_c0_g1_i1:405-731(-)
MVTAVRQYWRQQIMKRSLPVRWHVPQELLFLLSTHRLVCAPVMLPLAYIRSRIRSADKSRVRSEPAGWHRARMVGGLVVIMIGLEVAAELRTGDSFPALLKAIERFRS